MKLIARYAICTGFLLLAPTKAMPQETNPAPSSIHELLIKATRLKQSIQSFLRENAAEVRTEEFARVEGSFASSFSALIRGGYVARGFFGGVKAEGAVFGRASGSSHGSLTGSASIIHPEPAHFLVVVCDADSFAWFRSILPPECATTLCTERHLQHYAHFQVFIRNVEKSCVKERGLGQFGTLQKELTKSIDRLEVELTTAAVSMGNEEFMNLNLLFEEIRTWGRTTSVTIERAVIPGFEVVRTNHLFFPTSGYYLGPSLECTDQFAKGVFLRSGYLSCVPWLDQQMFAPPETFSLYR